MVFHVPDGTNERWEFEIGGVTYSLPRVKSLAIDVYEEMNEKFRREEVHAGLSLLTSDDTTTAALKSLQVGQFEALVNEWQKDSGVTMGE